MAAGTTDAAATFSRKFIAQPAGVSGMQPRRRLNRLLGVTTGLALVLAIAAPARADDDPPTRVGRIALIQGTVSFHASPDTDWSAAVMNYPVAAGTALWADQGSKAEIGLGEAEIWVD